MGISISDLLLRITSQKGEATNDVDELAGALEALDHTKAEATAQVDTDNTALEQLTLELDKFDHKKVEAKVGVDTGEAEAQLALFSHNLENLKSRSFKGQAFTAGDIGQFTNLFPHQGQMTLNVDLDTTKAQAEAVVLHEQLKFELGEEHVKVDVDQNQIDQARGAIGRLIDAFGSLAGEGAGVGNVLSNLGEKMGTVTVNFGMFGARLGPVLALVLAVALAVGVSLLSALVAVAASAAAAATALAAMGVALLGALAPIAAIAIPVVLMFGKVLSALQSQAAGNKAVATSTRDAATAIRNKVQADDQARSFAQQHADALLQVARAQQNLQQSTLQATQAMQDAYQKVTDSVLALQHAELNQQQAALDVQKAKQAVIDFRKQVGLTGKAFDAMFKTFTDVAFDPSKLNAALAKVKAPSLGLNADQQLQLKQLLLDERSAQLGVKDATDQTTKATVDLTRARQDAARYQREGLLANDSYKSALQGVADAERNLKRVESDRAHQLADNAKLAQATAMDQQAAAQGTLTKTQQLNAEELKLLAAVKAVIAAFKTAFGPAVNSVIDGFIAGLKIITPTILSLRGPITQLGRVMSAVIINFFKAMASPEFKNIFVDLINGAKQLLPYIDKIFVPMLDILGKIAVAAMPFLVNGFKSVAQWIGSLDRGLTIKAIRDFIRQLIPSLNQWVSLALALIPSFFKLIIAIAPFGNQLLKWITGIAIQLGNWAKSKKGRDEIHDFFTKTIPIAIAFLGILIKIIKFFVDITSWASRAAATVGNFFSSFSPTDWIHFITNVLSGNWAESVAQVFTKNGSQIMSGLWKGLKGFGLDIWNGVLKGPFTKAGNFLSNEDSKFFSWGRNTISGLWNGVKSIALDVAGWVSDKFNKGIAYLKGLPSHFKQLGHDIIQGLWNGIKSIGLDILGYVEDKFTGAIKWIKSLWQTFYDIGHFIIDGLWKGIKSVALDIKGFVESHLGDLLHFLQIGSPSKLMMEIGKNISLGLQVGLDRSSNDLSKTAMRTLAAPVVAAAGSATGAGSRGVTIQHQDVNLPAAPGHDQMGDPRHQAAQFAAEMRRRAWR